MSNETKRGVGALAERRMFTKKITDDDKFMALSSSAQALYLHLSMSADDDGFSNQVSISMFKAHASVQDLHTLLEMRYIYQFDNGVIVIKHWRMANALRKDRYTPTIFQEELSRLDVKGNGSYTWLTDRSQKDTEHLSNDRIEKNTICCTEDDSGKTKESKKNKKENLIEVLLPNYQISDYLVEYVMDWISYKKERGFSYKERGMRTLLKTISEKSLQYGDNEVANTISESISSGYQGIVWDKLLRVNRQQTGKKRDWGNV